MRNLDSFASVKMKRKKPEFKNCKLVNDVYEEEQVLYSFALKITYIGLDSKTEIVEALWKDGKMNPEILKGGEFEEVPGENDFKIPDEIMDEIKKKGELREREFQRRVEEERKNVVEHLERMVEEKLREGKSEEAERIREEVERRKNMPLPELRIKVEPISLLRINAPVEIHRSVLENEYSKKEVVWKFDNLTGEHDLRCDGCGKKANEFYLTVDGIACENCYKECKECGKPMINAYECKVCHEPLCEEHVHFCSTCHEPICQEHATKCEFCSNEMCPEHVNHCSVCNAPLCDEHAYSCVVCGKTIGPKHTRICEVCGGNVCPEHIHTCEICGKNVCENCASQIDGKWYCKDHLEDGYGGKLVLPEIRCKECGIAVAKEDVEYCEVCHAPLCPEHTHRCSVCGKTLCGEHVNRCSICNVELCDDHTYFSELSGKPYCEKHVGICEVCGRVVGEDEMHDGVCVACERKKEIGKREIPKEIFKKFPYAKKGKEWFISSGKNVAYITEIKGIVLSYRIVDGEIVEHRGKR